MKSTSMIPASNERISFLLEEHAKGHSLNIHVNEVAALTGFAVATLNQWRVTGDGPPFMRIGRAVRYRLSSVVEWMNQPEHASTSAIDAARLDETA